MHPGLDRLQIGRGEDPVEPRDRAAAVETVAGVDEPVTLGGVVRRTATLHNADSSHERDIRIGD